MASIPRFLLPRRGALWQTGLGRRWASTRFASPSSTTTSTSTATASTQAATPSPSNILEKPAKFNPPSHGARLPRKGAARAPASPHYGGELTAAERQALRQRHYPGMMSPEGTWSHWFWNSRALHMGITMTALLFLALFTFFENFRRTSPFVDLLPTVGQALRHPILAIRTTVEVVRLTEDQRIAEITEKRQRRVDDVTKRTLYRKAHGLPETVGFNSGWLTGGVKIEGPVAPQRNEEPMQPPPAVAAAAASALEADGTAMSAVVDDASPVRGAVAEEAPKRKRFLGVL